MNKLNKEQRRSEHGEPLAIIGMAVRLPGADSIDEFWELVVDGRSAISELPEERLDRKLFYNEEKGVRGKTYSSIGGIVSPRKKPPGQWLLTKEQSEDCDAAHLELCDVAATAFSQAGFDPMAMSGCRAGVYVGHTRGTGLSGDVMYGTMLADAASWLHEVEEFRQATGERAEECIDATVSAERKRLPRRAPDGRPAADAQRCSATVARAFGLDGPCVALNAACSSSLFALAAAADDLALGRTDMAVVGGSSHCRFDSLVLFSKAQSVSATGSRPFDASADGLVTAEGYVVVLVKTLRKAIEDGNTIQAVIRGIGVSSDGRGKSLWAPRQEGQIAAIERAHADVLDPARLGYIEAHATSTSVGDATEVNALARALKGHIADDVTIPIGSVKANIGHTLETAGLAGLVKAVLCMKHGTIPPVPGIGELNPAVDWPTTPFVVPSKKQEWFRKNGLARRAAVNSFGIGGLNAHVVLEEFLKEVESQKPETIRPVDSKAFSKVTADDDVAIVGRSVLAPGHLSAQQMWSKLTAWEHDFSKVPSDRWNVDAVYDSAAACNWKTVQNRGGFIEDFSYDWRTHKIPPKQIAAADPLQFMLLETVSQALQDAGYPDQPLPRDRTGVIVGTVFGGDFASALQVGMRLPYFEAALQRELQSRGVGRDAIESICAKFCDLVVSRLPAIVDETGSFTSSSLASRITKTFDLMGGATAIDGGAASAVSALDVCRNFLLTGRVDAMICAAGQRSLSLASYEILSLSGALSRSGKPRPFDQSSDGLMPAEGVAVFVLKRLSDALRDNDRIHGIVRGIGVSRHGKKSAGIQRAMRRAGEDARISSDSVSFVESAAAGVPADDMAELDAIQCVYGESLPIGAINAQIGHAAGASAGLSIAKTTFELQEQELRMPSGRSNSASHDHAAQPLHPNDSGRLVAGVTAVHCDTACHILLERGKPVNVLQRSVLPKETIAQTPQIIRFFGPTVGDLLGSLKACVQNPGMSFATSKKFNQSGHRLAIVAATPEELARKADLVVNQFDNKEARGLWETQGIAVGEVGNKRPVVACLFPGQGSQYPGMLREIIAACPQASLLKEQMNQSLLKMGHPTFEDIIDNHEQTLGKDVFRTQLSMLLADTLVFKILQEIGLRADRLTGHSYGEFSALHAADAFQFENAVQATLFRCRSIEEAPIEGGLVSCAVGEDVVAAACASFPEEVFVANCNSPQQTVVGGENRSLRRFVEFIQSEGIRTTTLDVPRPFHTPLMKPAQKPFKRALVSVQLDPPRIPLLSGVNNQYVAEPEIIRALLSEQLAQPVRFVDQIERLISDGVTLFVECGPDRVLSRLTRRIVGDRDITVLAADVRSRQPASSSSAYRLASLQAGLEVAGAIGVQPESDSSHLMQKESGVSQQGETLSQPENGPAVKRDLKEVEGCIELCGSRYDIGVEHGRILSAAIKKTLEHIVDLPPQERARLPRPEAIIDSYETMTTREQREELRGIAAGAGVAYESLVAMHIQIDPSLDGGCVQAVFPASVTRTHRLLQGANEDLPAALVLRDSIRRCIQFRKPTGQLASVAFTAAGVLSGINGMNECGIVVTSSMLLDQPLGNKRARGLMHSGIVDRILSTAASVDEAISIVQATQRGGCWAMIISDGDADRSVHLEYSPADVVVEEISRSFCIANHSFQLHASGSVPPHSESRLKRFEQLINAPQCNATPEAFSMMLRDRYDVVRQSEVKHSTMNTVQRVDNQISVVFDPEIRRVLCASRSPENQQVDFQEIDCREFFQAQQNPKDDKSGTQCSTAENSSNKTTIISVEDYASLGTSKNNQSPVDLSNRICTRFSVHLVPWQREQKNRFLRGGAIVVGQSEAAAAVVRLLHEQGIQVIRAADSALDEVSSLLMDESLDVSHLFMLDAFDDEPLVDGRHQWSRSSDALVARYELIQQWFSRQEKSQSVSRATLVVATQLGTPGGLEDGVHRPAVGGLVGLVKGIHTESRDQRKNGFHAVVVDFDTTDDCDVVARSLVDEACSATENPEIVYRAGHRFAVRPANKPLPDDLPNAEVSGCWVITGGARGVTAQVARGIGRYPNTVLHLVGSSPVPAVRDEWKNLDAGALRKLRESVMREALAKKELPASAWGRIEKAIEIDATLESLKAEGIEAIYHACDVGDREAVSALLDQIREKSGPIVGVIHGAGFEKASRFSKKKPELVRRTVRAKLDGALNLMELTKSDALRHFVVFGSISGRFGAVGQTDYCMANEGVAKLVRWYRQRRPEVASVVIAWHSWDDVGMAVRPESKFSKSLLKLRFMPPAEGVEHLLREMQAGCPEPEVVITDWRYFKLRHPDPLWLPANSTNDSPDSAQLKPTNRRNVPPSEEIASTAVRRHVLRMSDAPRASVSTQPLSGPALVVGECEDAVAVVRSLREAGVQVDQLSTQVDGDQILSRLESLLKDGRAKDLLLLTGREYEGSDIRRPRAWVDRRERGVVKTFLIAQKWFAFHAKKQTFGSAAAWVSLGGDFGTRECPRIPEGFAVAGLMRSMRIEAASKNWDGLKVAVVDTAPAMAPQKAARVFLEEAVDPQVADVGFDVFGKRRVLKIEADEVSVRPAISGPRRGAAWVAIGGGRGITSRQAFHLAERFGVRMHLVGTTPLRKDLFQEDGWTLDQKDSLKKTIARQALSNGQSPAKCWEPIERSIEIEETLRRFKQAGFPVAYHCCNASDSQAIQAVLQEIREADGPIEGIIQGAGTFDRSRFEQKSRLSLERTVEAKLDATFALLNATRVDPLKYFIASGSIAGCFGTNGNADYSMASSMQCGMMAYWRAIHPRLRTVGVHWHPWDEVGMMMRASSFASRQIMKLPLMSVDQGLRHLEQELMAGLPDTQVVFTDGSYQRWLDSLFAATKHIGSEGNPATTSRAESLTQVFPLIDSVNHLLVGKEVLAHAIFDPTREPFLVGHRFRDRPLLPFVISLEMLAEAACLCEGSGEFYGFDNVEIVSGLKFVHDQPQTVRVSVTKRAGELSAQVLSDFRNRKGAVLQRDRLHVKGQVVCSGTQQIETSAVRDERQPTDWADVEYPAEREEVIYHGPLFRRLTGVRRIDGVGWMRIVAGQVSEVAGDRNHRGWVLSTAVLDACFFGCGLLEWIDTQNVVAIPSGVRRLRFLKQPVPGEVCVQRIIKTGRVEDKATFDFILMNSKGETILSAEGFEALVLEGTGVVAS